MSIARDEKQTWGHNEHVEEEKEVEREKSFMEEFGYTENDDMLGEGGNIISLQLTEWETET